MTKQEIAELKKLLTPKNCSLTRICGCYVDGEKNKKTEFKQAFLALPEEEMFKYFEILRKTLSGSLGKNLLTLEFPLKSSAIFDAAPPAEANNPADSGSSIADSPSTEPPESPQGFLLRLRDSKLKDDALLEEFYDKVIESYE